MYFSLNDAIFFYLKKIQKNLLKWQAHAAPPLCRMIGVSIA
jgi:hypothetical protein